ncbi:UNVERIFIED_CONTAM: hypothetical protein GTU68_000305 [Idotea baltica]|nr:hypothetical protein [Idotea baltica]
MLKSKVLLQIDSDKHASSFDSIVAVDSGVDQLLTHANVATEDIRNIVHGAMFTRSPADLKRTAIFFGGSDVAATEAMVAAASDCFFDTMRVSIMSDPNGSNTTAAAAVLCAQRHLDFTDKTIVILAGTGPVGQRIAKIIGGLNSAAELRICSRQQEKSQAVVDALFESGIETTSKLVASTTTSPDQTLEIIGGADVVFAAGAAGIELLDGRWSTTNVKILVDLNAVPPSGIANIGIMDKGQERDGAICYGAIGVGGLKMKIHKQAIKSLFESNDLVLDTEAIYQIGLHLEQEPTL